MASVEGLRRRDHAQVSTFRLRIPDRHLAAGAGRGRWRACLQPATGAPRSFRKTGHHGVSGVHSADHGQPRHGANPSLHRRAARCDPQAARWYGRQPDFPCAPQRPEPQRHRRNPDQRRRAQHHGAALHPRDQPGRQTHPAHCRQAGTLVPGAHSQGRRNPRQPGRRRYRHRPGTHPARPGNCRNPRARTLQARADADRYRRDRRLSHRNQRHQPDLHGRDPPAIRLRFCRCLHHRHRTRMRAGLKLFLAVALVSLLAACGRTQLQEQQAYVFGTRVEVIIVSQEPEQGRQAISAVLREFDRMHRAYHAWQPSELTALNEAIAAGKSYAASPELAAFVAEAQALSQQGNFLFDPGIGHLIKLWGFQADEFKAELPHAGEIKAWLAAKPSIADLIIEDTTIHSRNREVALDFGGYLKGVALDRAANILRAQGIHNALINIGGNVMALGSKEGRKWRVGIQHPRHPGPLATVMLDDGEAIGTSGDYQRFFEVDGQRYAHLLDPRTGYPADHTQAVTVVIPPGSRSGTLSDAASKPIFIAGPDRWREMAAQMGIGLVMRVDHAGQIHVTEALQKRLEYLGKRPEIKVKP